MPKNHQINLGIASLYLKTYIDKTDAELAQGLDWMIPLQRCMTDDELINYLDTHKPDLFCTSNYIWNHSFIMSQLERIFTRLPQNTKIICGGPSIDVHINNNFFTKYPFVKYAVYAAGEEAFYNIIKSLTDNKKLIAFNTSNTAWYDHHKQQQIVAEFKYVPQLKWSPFLNNIDFFSRMVNNELDNNINITLPYELTRGCPYSCTFCDWNSGLTNKTTRRKNTFKDEIDLFQKLKIKTLYLSDANVGQYDEDIEMVTYLAEKNLKEGAGFKIDGNFSKLKKENNFKIYNLISFGNLASNTGLIMSIQDINLEVLKNIDRPDVGWEVHKDMIKKLKISSPHIASSIQLIQGLPGQTLDSWRNTLREISKEQNIDLVIYISELLPASPAAMNKSYQEKFKFVYSQSLRYANNNYFRGNFSESCISFSKKDFVEMTILSLVYSSVCLLKIKWHEEFDCEKVIDYFFTTSSYQKLRDNLYNNWVHHDKFYYTINIDDHEETISACKIHETAIAWSTNTKFLRIVITALYRDRNKESYKYAIKKYMFEKTNFASGFKIIEGHVV